MPLHGHALDFMAHGIQQQLQGRHLIRPSLIKNNSEKDRNWWTEQERIIKKIVK